MLSSHTHQTAGTSIYETEIEFAQHSQAIAEQSSYEDAKALHNEYKHLAKQYSVLLNETMKITRISDSMQVEMRRLQQDLKRSLAEAEEANRRKTELLSVVAHDLKNPIGAIMGLAEIITTMLPDDHGVQRFATQIQKTSDRTITLIKDLLDSAAMELGKIIPEFDEISISLLLTNVVEGYEISATNKQQKIVSSIQSGVRIQGDFERLRQVFDNLLSNAVKYSPRNTTITLRLQTIGERIRIEVQDEGQGFTEEDKQKLFGFFQRLSAIPTGGESSNGVGLAITKNIIDLHNGSIRCESELGKGTTFIVELPLRQQKCVS